jgi:hypothetical protein
VSEQIINPQPQELQDKFSRLEWGTWIPTPGVTDEDKELYVSLPLSWLKEEREIFPDLPAPTEDKHLYVMSAAEALSLSDEDFEHRLWDIMTNHRDEAVAAYERRKAVQS